MRLFGGNPFRSGSNSAVLLSSQSAPPTSNPARANDLGADHSDAPPAYSPAADLRRGETTLEVGPHRLFQSAPRPESLPLSQRPTHGRSHSESHPLDRPSQSHPPNNIREQTLPERLARFILGEPLPQPRQPQPRSPIEPTLPPPPPPPPPRVPRIVFTDSYYNPPAGALIVNPGDPRLGGELCWRCDGLGTIASILFDDRPCNLCGGTGRVYY